MKPVDQEHFRHVGAEQWGDCMRATLASLLELPLADVPHFAQEAKGEPSDYYEAIQDWLCARGFLMVMAMGSGQGKFFAPGCDHDVYHLISGLSPRGNDLHHSVVGKNGQIEHDPHPSRAGLANDRNEWTFSYLVKA